MDGNSCFNSSAGNAPSAMSRCCLEGPRLLGMQSWMLQDQSRASYSGALKCQWFFLLALIVIFAVCALIEGTMTLPNHVQASGPVTYTPLSSLLFNRRSD